MDLAPDFDEFIASLMAHGVEFVIVGAYALAFHGAPRFTGDLDVLVRPTVENAARLLAAVRAFGFPVTELQPLDIVAPSRILQMGVEPVQIHVMSAISGVSWDARFFFTAFPRRRLYRPTRIRMPASNARTAISEAGSTSAIMPASP